MVFLILSHPGNWVSSLHLRYHRVLVWKRSQRPRSYSGVCPKEFKEDKEAEEEEKEEKGGTVPSPSCSRSRVWPGHAGKDQVNFLGDPLDHSRFMLQGKTAAQKERARKIQRKRRQNKRMKAKSGKEASIVPPDATGHYTLCSSDAPHASDLSVPNWDHTYDYTNVPLIGKYITPCICPCTSKITTLTPTILEIRDTSQEVMDKTSSHSLERCGVDSVMISIPVKPPGIQARERLSTTAAHASKGSRARAD